MAGEAAAGLPVSSWLLLSAISSCTLPAVLLLARRRINASEPPCHNLETATLAQPPRLHAEKESQGGVEPPQPKVLRTAMGQPRLTRRLRIEEKISAGGEIPAWDWVSALLLAMQHAMGYQGVQGAKRRRFKHLDFC